MMNQNRRQMLGRQYTVPSPEIYPFQWFWDSCFHAIILSHLDIAAAKAELMSVCSRPLPSGMLPHIIYWDEPGPENNWGRELRGDVITQAFGTQGTSSLTQPSLAAATLHRLYTLDTDRSLVETLLPVLDRHFTYLAEHRTFGDNELVYIINPDESGEDNSPRFDEAQGLPAYHSAIDNLEKRIERMHQNTSCSFDAKQCMSQYFGVADSTFNILYYTDLLAMADLFEIMSDSDNAHRYRTRADQVQQALHTLRHNGLYYSFDHVTKKHIEVRTWSIFLPLYAKLLNDVEAQTLVKDYLCDQTQFATPYLIPTTAVAEPSYDPQGGFWRGPVWHGANWFIYHGLKNYGMDELAETVRQSSLDLLGKSGFREQYHPMTGEGQGAQNFTWGGLVIDMC